MPQSRVRRTVRSRQPRLPKQMLLPLSDAYVREQLLVSHMAIVGCSAQEGNRHCFHELIRITYLAFLLWKLGYGHADLQLFADGEAALNAAVKRSQEEALWRLDESELSVLRKIVSVHDEQLAGVSMHSLLIAEARLETMLSKPRGSSPIKA